jgi:hypothetical protein
MPRLSVVVITRNEIHNIGACLRSVAFADEVVVVDSGSSDGTVEAARAAGATVLVREDWPGFGPRPAEEPRARCRHRRLGVLDRRRRTGDARAGRQHPRRDAFGQI